MNQADLKRLKHDTNEIIQAIRHSEDRPQEAINWADLKCTQAAFVTTDDGSEYLEVSIEEASPEAGAFQFLIASHLAYAGWLDVTVRTEW